MKKNLKDNEEELVKAGQNQEKDNGGQRFD